MNVPKAAAASRIAAVAIASGFMLLGASTSWAQQHSLRPQLVGAWTLVSQDVTPKDGTKRPSFGGPEPKGILILDASGHFAFAYGKPDRAKLTTTVRSKIPAAELGEAARTFAANFGTWSLSEDGKTLARKFQLALIPNNDNNEIKQTVTLVKGELKLVQVTTAGATVETIYRRAK